MKITKNIGTADRVVRIIAGATLLALVPAGAASQFSEWALLGLVGVVPLLAGLVGYCPPYAILGINTRRGRRGQTRKPADDRPETACC